MNFRHGDLALISIDKLPKGLKESTSKILATGSSNNKHTFDYGKFYPVAHDNNSFVIGYFKAYNNTKLFHPEHGEKIKGKKLRQVSIPAGFYELRRQVEDTHDGMKQVVD